MEPMNAPAGARICTESSKVNSLKLPTSSGTVRLVDGAALLQKQVDAINQG